MRWWIIISTADINLVHLSQFNITFIWAPSELFTEAINHSSCLTNHLSPSAAHPAPSRTVLCHWQVISIREIYCLWGDSALLSESDKTHYNPTSCIWNHNNTSRSCHGNNTMYQIIIWEHYDFVHYDFLRNILL